MRTFFILTSLAMLCTYSIHAQNYQVHSIYVYSFTKYIKWPDDASASNFRIGVWGKSEITAYLKKMAETKKAGNKTIEIAEVSDVKECSVLDILFISKGTTAAGQWDKLVAMSRKQHILLLTEEDEMPLAGHINFRVEENKTIFQLKRSNVESAGLQVASELIALAKLI